jgi:hypothetical protein
MAQLEWYFHSAYPTSCPQRRSKYYWGSTVLVSCSHYHLQRHPSNYSTPNEGLPEPSAQSQLPFLSGKHHRHKVTSQGCHMFDWLNEAQSLSSKLDEAEMEEVGLEINMVSYIT